MIPYPKLLAEKALLAQLPRSSNAPTVVSTFAGGGGSLTGYLMAGFNDLLAVEWDDNAVLTLQTNYPDLDIFHGDIHNLSIGEVLERTNLEKGELDILDGSPPCQGFSVLGSKTAQDSRNFLFLEYVRLLKGMMPKVCLIENVLAMTQGKRRVIYLDMITQLQGVGYQVVAGKINAKHLNVPQHRRRVIIVGIRNDLNLQPTFPKKCSHTYTVKEALNGLPPQEVERPMKDWLYKLCKSGEISGATSFDKRKKIFIKIKGTSGGAMSVMRNQWDLPSKTIVKSEIDVSGLIHPLEPRYHSLAEIKRLGSFPDGYWFLDRKTGVQRIGNSVPPLMTEAIATHIRKTILEKI